MNQTQTELGNDWYLDRVEVTGPEGVCWAFPCDDWFGRTEDDESIGEQLSTDVKQTDLRESYNDALHCLCMFKQPLACPWHMQLLLRRRARTVL